MRLCWLGDDFEGLKKLKIERKLFPFIGWKEVQLHVFGDASEGAYKKKIAPTVSHKRK